MVKQYFHVNLRFNYKLIVDFGVYLNSSLLLMSQVTSFQISIQVAVNHLIFFKILGNPCIPTHCTVGVKLTLGGWGLRALTLSVAVSG